MSLQRLGNKIKVTYRDKYDNSGPVTIRGTIKEVDTKLFNNKKDNIEVIWMEYF